MIEVESTSPLIAMNSNGPIILTPAYLINTGNGKRMSPQCQINVTGPVTLVVSRFVNLYYVVQVQNCTCSRGRSSHDCQHIKRVTEQQVTLEVVAQMQATPDDDLAAHVDDDLFTNVIRGNRIVRVLKADLTRAEKRAIYVASFNPCGGAA